MLVLHKAERLLSKLVWSVQCRQAENLAVNPVNFHFKLTKEEYFCTHTRTALARYACHTQTFTQFCSFKEVELLQKKAPHSHSSHRQSVL